MSFDFISDDQFREAQTAPLVVRQGVREVLPTHAEFVAEMARQVVFDAYGEEAYTRGMTVWTTIRKADQEAAYAAVRRGVIDYDRRHGYRGPEAYVEPARRPGGAGCGARHGVPGFARQRQPPVGRRPAGDAGRGARRAGERRSDPGHRRRTQIRGPCACRQGAGGAADPPRRGHPVPRDDKAKYAIAPLPQAEAAFVAVRAATTARSWRWSAASTTTATSSTTSTQALRQPGSAFKPFIYSAALEKGFTPSTVINDAPFFVPAAQAGGEDWEPKNYDGKFDGPMRLRTALAKSKNLVTVRVLQAIGPQYAQDYIAEFGFDPKLHPAYLTMGLGAGSATPHADGERLLRVRQRRLPRSRPT